MTLATLEGQRQHYAGVRQRLYGSGIEPVKPRLVRSLRLVAPPAPAVELPDPKPPAETTVSIISAETQVKPGKAPLNMLAPCSWRFLLALAALRHGIHTQDILGLNRTKPVARARHEAAWLIAFHTTHSLARIGRYMQRDHTTIINSLKHFPPFERQVPNVIADAPALVRKPKPTRNAPPKASEPKGPTALQKAVRRAYQHNVPANVLADEYGCNPGSVKVIAHRLGLKRSDFRPKSKLDWAT